MVHRLAVNAAGSEPGVKVPDGGVGGIELHEGGLDAECAHGASIAAVLMVGHTVGMEAFMQEIKLQPYNSCNLTHSAV